MYGVEAASATPKNIGSLTAAVIDVFKSRNNNHNANQLFSTITRSNTDLDPAAQIFARRVMQIRRTACKKEKAEVRFKHLLKNYATKHKGEDYGPNGIGMKANTMTVKTKHTPMSSHIHRPTSTKMTGTMTSAHWGRSVCSLSQWSGMK